MFDKVDHLDDDEGTLIVVWYEPPSCSEKQLFIDAWSSNIGDASDNVKHCVLTPIENLV